MPTAALLCVCGIATGQLLFKCTADSQALSGSYLHPALSCGCFQPYCSWSHNLRLDLDLAAGTSFPHLSLDGAGLRDCATAECSTLGERLQATYWLGVTMIVAGVTIAVRS